MNEVIVDYLRFSINDWEEHRISLFLLVSRFISVDVKSQESSVLFDILTRYHEESQKLIQYFSDKSFHRILRKLSKPNTDEKELIDHEYNKYKKEVVFFENMFKYFDRIEEEKEEEVEEEEESLSSYILEFDFRKDEEFHFISDLFNFGIEFFNLDSHLVVKFLIYFEPCDLSLHCVRSFLLSHPTGMKGFIESLLHHHVSDPSSGERVERILDSIIELGNPKILKALRNECTDKYILIENIFRCCLALGDVSSYLSELFKDPTKFNISREICLILPKVLWFRQHLLSDGIFGDNDETRTLTDLRVLSIISNFQTNMLVLTRENPSNDDGNEIMEEAEELETLEENLNLFTRKWYLNQKVMDLYIIFLFFHLKFNQVRPLVTKQLGIVIPRIWKDENLSFSHKKLVVFLASIFYSKMDERLFTRVESILEVPKVDLSLEETDLFSSLVVEEYLPLEDLAQFLLQGRPASGEDRQFVLEKIYFFLQYKVLRKFSMFGEMMKDWFLNGQAKFWTQRGDVPDSLLAPFLDEWVSNSVPSSSGSKEKNMTFAVFSEREFSQFLEDCERDVQARDDDHQIEVVKCVLLYYCLSLNTHARVPRSWKFSCGFLEKLGILPLTRFVWMRRKFLGSFGRHFIGKILKHCPSLFELQVTLGGENDPRLVFVNDDEEISLPEVNMNDRFGEVLNSPFLNQAKTREVLLEVLDLFSGRRKGSSIRLRARNEELFLVLLDRLLMDVNSRPEKFLMETYEKLWIALYRSWPLRVALKTLNVLHGKTLTHEEVMKDVFMVFRVKKEVFHCAPLFRIFLHLLHHFMSFTEQMWSGQRSGQQIGEEDNEGDPEDDSSMTEEGESQINTDAERLEIQKRLVDVEQSALLQLLLEVCLFTESDDVRKMICEFFHHRFIEKPVLAKLIHFQGYRLELLPLVTKYVKSIHICYDFLHELLDHTDLEKKVFGIQLAGYIIKKNNMVTYIPMARFVIDKIRVLGVKGTGSESRSHRNMVLCCFDTLIRLVESYPFLSGEIIGVLKEISMNFKNDYQLQEKIQECFSNLLDDVLKI